MADAGCVGALRSFLDNSAPSVTTTPTPASPTPLPTATPAPTPAPTAPVHVDIIYSAPLEAGGVDNSSPVHVITGYITYNGDPAKGYNVIVDTWKGYEYGNQTDSKGNFKVTFRDNHCPTYTMKVANENNIILYADKSNRSVDQTGPYNIDIERPSSGQISVTITP